MNSDQLKCAVKETRCLDAITVGVFSSDSLPYRVRSYPSAYICNTDRKGEPGQHWVVFWFQNRKSAEFYDSFGHSPEYYNQNFVHFLKNNAASCVYNNVPLQNNNYITCGHHVLYYLLSKCRGLTMHNIVELLKHCISVDVYVYEVVTAYFSCL